MITHQNEKLIIEDPTPAPASTSNFFYLTRLRFTPPAVLTERTYEVIKRFGLNYNSNLPNFFKCQQKNIVVTAICLLLYQWSRHLLNGTLEIICGLIFLILIYMILKIVYDSYNYFKFRFQQRAYIKKLSKIISRAENYMMFEYLYNYEINTSAFGKYLINKFIVGKKRRSFLRAVKKRYLAQNAYDMLLSGQYPLEEIKGWLFNEGLTEEIASDIADKCVKRQQNEYRLKLFGGAFLMIAGFLLLNSTLKLKSMGIIAIIVGGILPFMQRKNS